MVVIVELCAGVRQQSGGTDSAQTPLLLSQGGTSSGGGVPGGGGVGLSAPGADRSQSPSMIVGGYKSPQTASQPLPPGVATVVLEGSANPSGGMSLYYLCRSDSKCIGFTRCSFRGCKDAAHIYSHSIIQYFFQLFSAFETLCCYVSHQARLCLSRYSELACSVRLHTHKQHTWNTVAAPSIEPRETLRPLPAAPKTEDQYFVLVR